MTLSRSSKSLCSLQQVVGSGVVEVVGSGVVEVVGAGVVEVVGAGVVKEVVCAGVVEDVVKRQVASSPKMFHSAKLSP
jgi:hypothetical protein